MKDANAIRIGLVWHSVRSGNLGVGALTVGNIALIREACAGLGLEPSFLVLGPREPGPVYVQGAGIAAEDIDTRYLLSPKGYWGALSRVDCVVDIGAGDSFADIYGAKRFGFLWLTKMLAIARGRPLLLSPQTIGPFEHPAWRRLAAGVMNKADAVLARDPLSLEVAQAMAAKADPRLAVDVAFALPYAKRERAADGPAEIGVNVSGLLFNAGYKGDNAFGLDVDYAALTRGLLSRLAARDDLKVKLVTHVVSETEASDDDRRVADQLASEFPEVDRVPDFASPSDAKSYISGLDLLIAGRMHACIAAYSSGVPVIPIAYSRKFAGLFEGVLGYRHGVPVKGWSTGQALDYLVDAIERRPELRSEVRAGLAGVEQKLDVYRGELRKFLELVAKRRPS